MKEILDLLINNVNSVSVKNRSISVPPNYRTIYMVTQSLLIINQCSGSRKGCSMQKLQIIWNAISAEEAFENLMDFIEHRSQTILIRFDSMLNRALLYAISGELIVIQKNKSYRLTKKGKEFIESVICHKDILVDEKRRLEKISLLLTDEKIEELILGGWKNVED